MLSLWACLKQRSYITIRKKIILKSTFPVLNTIFYFLKLKNTWHSICQNDKVWVLCGPFPFLLFALDYLSKHSHSHIGLILLIAWNLPHYLILLSVCLYGWSNSNISLIHLTIKTGIICSIDRLKGGTLEPWITGATWFKRGDLIPLFIP